MSEVQEPRPDVPAAPPVAANRPEVRPPDDRSPDELRADLGELRVELGETVQELAQRVDVQLRGRGVAPGGRRAALLLPAPCGGIAAEPEVERVSVRVAG